MGTSGDHVGLFENGAVGLLATVIRNFTLAVLDCNSDLNKNIDLES